MTDAPGRADASGSTGNSEGTDPSDPAAGTAASGDLMLILLLAAVTAAAPFTLHALSPALPAISGDLGVPAGAAQLLLSLSLVAMALTTLIWGPLSDRFGRRPVLLVGLGLAAAGSVLAAVAPVLWIALAGRLAQAAGAAAGMVLARAVAQDVFGPTRAAGAIGQITAVMVAAPMIAPTIAGVVVEYAGWRGVFWMSAALIALITVWTWRRLQETAAAPARGGPSLIAGFAEVGRRRAFWRHAGYAAFSLAGFYYFVAVTPYVMSKAFGQGPAAYGVYFILLSATFMVTNFIAGRVSRALGSERVLVGGALLSLVGPSLSASLLLSGVDAPWALFLPGMIQSFGAGLAMPNAMAGAVGAAPGRAGAASGLLGFAQFMVAAVSTQTGGFLPHGEALIVPLGQLACLVLAMACLLGLRAR